MPIEDIRLFRRSLIWLILLWLSWRRSKEMGLCVFRRMSMVSLSLFWQLRSTLFRRRNHIIRKSFPKSSTQQITIHTGLSQRANHPPASLKLLHDTLFNLKCDSCEFIEYDNYDDPVHPSLLVDDASITARLAPAKTSVSATIKILDYNTPKTIDPAELPHCPSCKTGLLRPGVVWFGESLPEQTLRDVHTWIDEGPIDLILVVGTTAAVYPAAGYVSFSAFDCF